MIRTQLLKVIVIFALFIFIYSLLVAHDAPALGYEVSIYESTPLILWVALAFNTIIGSAIVFYGVYQNPNKKFVWLYGFPLIVLSCITFISIHIIRSYFMWCINGDPSTHINHVNMIITTGYTPISLMYPITHIFAAEFNYFVNENIVSLHKYIPFILGVLNLFFMFAFINSILPSKNQKIIGYLSSCILLNGWYLNFTPNHLSNLFFPIVLFIIIKTIVINSSSWRVLLIIMMLLYPPFHIIPSLAIFFIFVAIWTEARLANLINFPSNKLFSVFSELNFNIFVIAILFVWSITWISSFGVWAYAIKNYFILVTEGGPNKLNVLTESIGTAFAFGYNVPEYILKTEGGILVFILLTILSYPILRSDLARNKKLLPLFSSYSAIFLLLVVFLLLFLGDFSFGPLRMVAYLAILCTPFVGYLLSKFIEKLRLSNKKANAGITFIILILFVSIFFNSTLTIYPSPYILGENTQTTRAETYGMEWFFHTRVPNIGITGISIVPARYANLFLSSIDIMAQKIPTHLSSEMKVPYHFGYDNSSTISSYYSADAYLIISEKDRLRYVYVFPDMAKFRWYTEDFAKLNEDKGAEEIYNNNGFNIYFIHALLAGREANRS